MKRLLHTGAAVLWTLLQAAPGTAGDDPRAATSNLLGRAQVEADTSTGSVLMRQTETKGSAPTRTLRSPAAGGPVPPLVPSPAPDTTQLPASGAHPSGIRTPRPTAP